MFMKIAVDICSVMEEQPTCLYITFVSSVHQSCHSTLEISNQWQPSLQCLPTLVKVLAQDIDYTSKQSLPQLGQWGDSECASTARVSVLSYRKVR